MECFDDMKQDDIEKIFVDLLEHLAAIEHDRWSKWQKYVHNKGVRQPDGSIVIPAEFVERWDRQIATSYENLSEIEKESDREQVHDYIHVIKKALLSQ